MTNNDNKNKNFLQIIWGALLLFAGIGVFFRIPQIMPDIEKVPQFASAKGFIMFCLYFIGIFLVFGGGKKIYENWKGKNNKSKELD